MSDTAGGRWLRVVVHHLAPGRHLLIDPCYVGETEAARAHAADTWFTGSDGGFKCIAWAAEVEGAEGRRGHEGRLRADLIVGVDSASIVLLDEQGLRTLEPEPRLDVGAVRRGRGATRGGAACAGRRRPDAVHTGRAWAAGASRATRLPAGGE